MLAAHRPSHLIFEWHPAGPAFTTTVELTFERVAVGTIARVRESGFPDTLEGMNAMIVEAAGWGEALTLVRFYVERGLGKWSRGRRICTVLVDVPVER